MRTHGVDRTSKASCDDGTEREPRRSQNSESDSDNTTSDHQHAIPVEPGVGQFSAAIAAIQQVTQQVHELLSSVDMASVESHPEAVHEAENTRANNSEDDWEDMEEDAAEEVHSSGDSNVGIVMEDEEEEDPFEDEEDPFEGDSDIFDDELSDHMLDDSIDPFDLVDPFDLGFADDSDESDGMMWDQSEDDNCTTEEDSDLPSDPYEREALGSKAEPQISLHAAVVRGDSKALSRWQARGTSVWARRVKGDTDLHFAARSGDVSTVELLVQEGAQLNVTNKKRHTPLEVAALCGHAGVVKVLLKYGAGEDSEEMEHALLAAKSTAVIRVLADDDKDAVTGVTGAEILNRAVSAGRVIMVQTLLKVGANPNWPGSYSRTALHTACSKGHIRCVTALLENGADVHSVDDRRWTPLHYAASNNHGEVVQKLLEAGANVNLKSGRGETPLDLALDDFIKKVLSERSEPVT